MNLKILFVVIFISFLVPISNVESADVLLKMNVLDSKPLGYLNNKGELKGFQIDFYSHLEKVSGIKIEMHLFPFARGWRNIKNGILDGGLLFKADNRAKFLVPVQFMFNTHMIALGRKGIRIDSIQELSKYRVGKLKAMVLNKEITGLIQENLDTVTKYSQLVKMLAGGRIDVAIGSYYTLYRHSEELGVNQKFEFPGLFLTSQEVWLYLSKKSENLQHLNRLREAAKKISESDYIDSLFQKHYLTPSLSNVNFEKK